MFVLELLEPTNAVLLCNDDPIIGWRRKKGLEGMHVNYGRCGPVMYLVIAMQSLSGAPEEALP